MGLPAYKLSPDPPEATKPRDPAEVLRPWERMDREHDSAWALFMAYRDSGYPDGIGGKLRPRTVRAIAEMAGMNEEYVGEVSRGFHWVQRAGAWDREVDRRKTREDLREVDLIRRRMNRRVEKLSTLLEMEIDKALARATDPDMAQMTPKDIVATAEFVTKIERLMAGESTENVSHTGAWDLEKLTVEELEALDRIRRKAQGVGG